MSQGKLMAMLFRSQLVAEQLDLRLLTGEKVLRQTVLGFLEGITDVREEDSIVFYYSGHGTSDSSGEQFLQFGGEERVFRREVRDQLPAKRARNVVLITDVCSPTAIETQKGREPTARVADHTITGTSPLFRFLFFEHRGVLDLTSSYPGEMSGHRSDGQGSILTCALVDVLNRQAYQPASWKDIISKVNIESFRSVTAEQPTGYDGNKLQYAQCLRVFGLNRGPVFGGRLALRGSDGLIITEVVDGSPAWRPPASLRRGHTVLRINDRRLETEEDYARAVDSSPKQMSLTVRRPGGAVETVDVYLDRE
jgi:hypothetical protein